MPVSNNDPTLFVDLLLGAILCLLIVLFGWKYWGLIKSAPKLWMHRSSERWPWATATFEDGRVKLSRNRYNVASYSVFVRFTYRVAGEAHPGWYWKSLGGISGKDADNLFQSLRQGRLYIRYRPSNPKDYVCGSFRDVRPPEAL